MVSYVCLMTLVQDFTKECLLVPPQLQDAQLMNALTGSRDLFGVFTMTVYRAELMNVDLGDIVTLHKRTILEPHFDILRCKTLEFDYCGLSCIANSL